MEITALINKFAEFGLLGLVVICLMVYIIKIGKSHANERELWRKESNQINFKLITIIQKVTSAVESSKSAINRLSDILISKR